MSSLEASGFWIALNAFLLCYLSFRVGQTRIKNKIYLGDGEHPELIKAIRTQGNYIEYAPAALIGMLALSLLGANVIFIHIIGAAFFFARVSHLLGLGMDIWPKGRFVGTLLTMITLSITGIGLLYLALT